MGTVFKKLVTRPMPPGAEIVVRDGQRIARWKFRGKLRTAPVTTGTGGSPRIVTEAATYTAKYRDGSEVVREVSTGCRDETAARRVLAELERRAELVKAGVLTKAEDAVADHQATPIETHFRAYGEHLEAKGTTTGHRVQTLTHLRRLAEECGFRRLADLDRADLERWLTRQERAGMSAMTRNAYRRAAVAFANWCVQCDPRNRRLLVNPFQGTPKANAAADPRRKRRSLTEDELVRLLDVAQRRPLLDAATIRRGPRKGQGAAKLQDATRAKLAFQGRERALLYKTLVLTGLRVRELASLTVGQVHLDEKVPFIVLNAADEKNRRGSEIPLRDDLAADLRDWLADLLARRRAETLQISETRPARLPLDLPLFNVPAGLLRILNRDLERAGIPKRDERGRTIDVHGLRTTFGTLLSKGGVPLRTAQAAMRHSDPRLTANVYTDPKLLDVRGALDSLPELPLDRGTDVQQIAAIATGTDGMRPELVAPLVAPTADKTGVLLSFPDNTASKATTNEVGSPSTQTATPVKGKGKLTTADKRLSNRGDRIRTCDFMLPKLTGENPMRLLKANISKNFKQLAIHFQPFTSILN